MEQMITKEQIAEAAEQYAEQENSAWTNDYNGFEAGANFVMQLLQQTPCTTQLPSDDELFAIVEKILFEQTSSDPMTECVNKMNLLRQFINDKCLSAIA